MRLKEFINKHHVMEDIVDEFASTAGGGDDILKTLAAQWLHGDIASGDLSSDTQSQEQVERRLEKGIICPDGAKRKLYIDYSDDYECVVIYSDDDWSITYKQDDLSESKQGVSENGVKADIEEYSLKEIDYSSELDSTNFSHSKVIKLGVVDGQIDGHDVMKASSGDQTVYFLLSNDSKVSAFLGFKNGYLKNIKNFSGASGLISALVGYVVHIKKEKIKISPDEPMTESGIKWLSKLIKQPRGLTITNQRGESVDAEALKQEWSNAKNTGAAGTTGITINENFSFGNKIRLNEESRKQDSILMPHNFYISRKEVAEDSLNEFATSGDDDNRPQRPMLLADVAKIIKAKLGPGWTMEHVGRTEQPGYKFIPTDKTKHGMAKIWCLVDWDKVGEYPTYNTIQYSFQNENGRLMAHGRHTERAKPKTVSNALVTAQTILGNTDGALKDSVTEDTVDEMALKTYKTMGDFSKPGPFKDPDYKLVTHPVHIQKVTDFFQRVPHDFRFFMSNLPGMRKYQESGEKTPQEIQQMFGEKIAREILQDTGDAITVIYIGNYGQNKVMMSPHTMAHRVGHAITAAGRYERSKVIPEWTELYNHFFNQLKKIVVDCYQRPESNRYDYFTTRQQSVDMEAKYMALMYQIGTLKSSRERNLNNTYEFLYEMLAQYIRTGKVTLNPLPISAGYGRLVGWKTKSFQKYIRINSECSDELYRTEVTQRLARDMGILFGQVLGGCVGKIFVM